MKRKLTPEQQAASEARRAKAREIAKRIAAMSPEQRAHLAATYPVVTIEGHPLSTHNQCMIAYQKSGATVVGGFQQWKYAGRTVRRGEHGASIWVPIGGTKGEELPSEETSGSDHKSRQRFMLASVFDISQTEEIVTAIAA